MESIGPNNLATVSYSYIHRALTGQNPALSMILLAPF